MPFLKELFAGGGYPFVVDESMGLRNWPKMAVVNEARTQEQPNKPLRLGAYIADDHGSIYQYVKCSSALALGTVVIPSANVTGAVVTADATGDGIHVIKTTLTAATGVDSEVGNFLIVAAAASATQIAYKILGNTSGANSYITISKKDIRMGRGGYDGNANKVAGVDTVMANAVVCHIHRPYTVTPCTAAEQNAVGVSQGVVTSGYGTLVQVAGMGLVLGQGTTDPIVEGEAICTSATAGNAKGLTTAATTGLDAIGKVGVAAYPLATGQALIPAYIQLFGKW